MEFDVSESFFSSSIRSAFFDLTKLIYSKNLNRNVVMNTLRKFDFLCKTTKASAFASVRFDIFCNEFIYIVPKIIIISEDASCNIIEEKWSESNMIYNVSVVSRAAGKVEIDDRNEFGTKIGFRSRAGILNHHTSSNNIPEKRVKVSEPLILIEDSDRDSDDDLDADSNF